MAGQELKDSEKKVLKMTRDGAVEENLVTNAAEKVSKRTEEAVLKQEVSPELLAKYKAAGIEKPTPNRRQYTNLKFGKNNPDKPTEDDNADHQQSEQTVSAVMPVVSISFTPKKVDKEFLTRNVNKQRKEQRKLNKQLAKEQQTENVADNPEDSPDTPISEESKLKDRKTRNTLEEHSSAADSLNEESEDSSLIFENEDEAVDVSENSEAKPKPKAEKVETADMTEVPDAPDVPKENKAPLSKEDKRLSKKVVKDEKKLAKAEKRLEKAENKLPTEKVVTFEKKLDAKSGKYKRKLRFETEVKPSDRKLPLSSGAKGVKQSAKTALSNSFHNEIAKYEEENPTLKAAHSTEKVAESALHTAESAMKTAYQNHKSAPYRKVSKLKFQKEKAEQKLSYHKALSENPELRSGENKKAAAKAAMKKAQQKQNQKKAAKETKKAAEKVKEAAEEIGKKIVEVVASNKWVIIILVVVLIVFALFGTLCTSCCSSFVDNGTVMLATTYTSKDEDIYAANDYMTSLENSLSDYINHIPDYYVGWNEYNYHLDSIGHDPYQLTSFLSAMRIAFQYDADIQNRINELYNEIYTLDVVSTHEVRSYSYITTDDEGNETEVTVYYDYFILDVYLTANDFESVIRPKLEAAGVYDLYLAMQSTQGGKPNLF